MKQTDLVKMLSGDRQIRVPNDPKERQLYYETIQALLKRLSNLAADFEEKLRKGMEVTGWTVKTRDKGNTTVASVPELALYLEGEYGIPQRETAKHLSLSNTGVGKLLDWRDIDWQKEWAELEYKCFQCKGKGFLRVAYNDEDMREVNCEWCDGKGTKKLIETAPPPKPRVMRRKDATPIPDEFFDPIIDVDIQGNTKEPIDV